jgi:hypothetical protein
VAFNILLIVGMPGRSQEARLGSDQSKITTASAVRARTGPQFAAQEVGRLKLGTIVNALARSAEQDQIGAKKDYWYRVNLPTGESGWVFGGLLKDYDPAHRGEILRQIIDERLTVEQMTAEDGMDLYNFVLSALTETKDAGARGELELSKLLALSRWFGGIPIEQRERPPYSLWVKAHEREVVYSEPSGQWLVRSGLYWDLERKYKGTSVGERIAWAAAQNPLPGECESDEVCQFMYVFETDGKYLEAYPTGAHAGEAMANLEVALSSEGVKSVLNSKSTEQDAAVQRSELKKAIAALRVSVGKAQGTEKEALQKMLIGM